MLSNKSWKEPCPAGCAACAVSPSCHPENGTSVPPASRCGRDAARTRWGRPVRGRATWGAWRGAGGAPGTLMLQKDGGLPGEPSRGPLAAELPSGVGAQARRRVRETPRGRGGAVGEGEAVTRHSWPPPRRARLPAQPGYPERPKRPGHSVEGLSHGASEGGEGSRSPSHGTLPPTPCPPRGAVEPVPLGARTHSGCPSTGAALDLRAERGRDRKSVV